MTEHAFRLIRNMDLDEARLWLEDLEGDIKGNSGNEHITNADNKLQALVTICKRNNELENALFRANDLLEKLRVAIAKSL